MANNPFFSDTAVIAMVTAKAALLNGGSILIYSGTQPADANTAISGNTLLATLTFSATAYGTPTASGTAPSRIVTAVANTITGANAANTGTASWFRCVESNGTTVVGDGSIGTSGADLNLNTTSLVSGVPVAITALNLTETET